MGIERPHETSLDLPLLLSASNEGSCDPRLLGDLISIKYHTNGQIILHTIRTCMEFLCVMS